MSLYSYKVAGRLDRDEQDFYGLLMAAMLKADTINLERLGREWPEVVAELQQRYNAPQGLLPGERNPETGDTREELDALREKAGLDQTGGKR